MEEQLGTLPKDAFSCTFAGAERLELTGINDLFPNIFKQFISKYPMAITPPKPKKRVAVLISGTGTNLQVSLL